MIKSMTGYGSAKLENDKLSVNVEIRTLNSKNLDATIKLPKTLNEKELEIRKILADSLIRGKLSVTIELVRLDAASVVMDFNKSLFNYYYNKLSDLAKEVAADEKDLFRMALLYPEVVQPKPGDETADKDWEILRPILKSAIDKCNSFRLKEGESLEKVLLECSSNIESRLLEIDKHDKDRIEEVKKRIRQSLEELKIDTIDENRFEQELIYYLEKLDVSEEKVRLKTHIEHFRDVLKGKGPHGRKLNFISQEMGREINTIGSKANHSPIQKLVVGMKDELEKIKEQVLNIM